VLELEHESVPSRSAEIVSRACLISKCGFVDVVANLFDTSKNAFSTFYHTFNNWIIARLLFNLFGKGHENNSDESNDCNNERSNSKRSSVGETSTESNTNVSIPIFMGVRMPVISACRYHNGKCAAVFEESSHPEDSEEHVEGHISNFWFPDKIFTLWNILVNFNMVH